MFWIALAVVLVGFFVWRPIALARLMAKTRTEELRIIQNDPKLWADFKRQLEEQKEQNLAAQDLVTPAEVVEPRNEPQTEEKKDYSDLLWVVGSIIGLAVLASLV